MTEVVTELKKVLVQKKCDQCNEGFLIGFGMHYLSFPTKRDHKCNKCGTIVRLCEDFPREEWRPA